MNWFQIGKGARQGCILASCLFVLYAEYIMRHAGLDESQAEIKISRRNIQILRYRGSLVVQMVKNLPVMQETCVLFLGWKDSLEKEVVTHDSILSWRIPWTEEAWRAPVRGAAKSQT